MCIYVCLYTYLDIYIYIPPSIYLSIYLFIYLSVYLSIYLSFFPFYSILLYSILFYSISIPVPILFWFWSDLIYLVGIMSRIHAQQSLHQGLGSGRYPLCSLSWEVRRSSGKIQFQKSRKFAMMIQWNPGFLLNKSGIQVWSWCFLFAKMFSFGGSSILMLWWSWWFLVESMESRKSCDSQPVVWWNHQWQVSYKRITLPLFNCNSTTQHSRSCGDSVSSDWSVAFLGTLPLFFSPCSHSQQ